MTVLMVPFILVATMLVVQFGLTFWASQVLSGAAQDGAARAALAGSSPAAGVAVTDSLVRGAGGHLIVGYSASSSVTDTTVTITARGRVESLIPFLSDFSLSRSSSATFEEFRVPGDG